MKASISFLVCTIGLSIHCAAQGLTLPADSAIQDSIKRGDDIAPATPEELAAPPTGQVQLLLVNSLRDVSTDVAQLLTDAPNDVTGKQSPLYPTCQAFKTKFDQFINDHTHSSLFALIPDSATVLGRSKEDEPALGFLWKMEGAIENCGSILVQAMSDHVAQQQGTVSGANLQNFVKVFALPGFYSEASFEDTVKPIDAAGVMILDATAVVNQLKAAPWQQAQRFLGDAANAAGYFPRYLSSGDGLAVLKTKYAQNQAAIDAQFSELKTWVTQQEAAAGSL